jgi:hypothetical protein
VGDGVHPDGDLIEAESDGELAAGASVEDVVLVIVGVRVMCTVLVLSIAGAAVTDTVV